MDLPSDSQLLASISDSEDPFIERKSDGGGGAEFRKTIVAFANSLPPERVGVLYVGASNDGTVPGVSEPDKLQRTLRRIAEVECYPPIDIVLRVLKVQNSSVVAVIVPSSSKRPHFAGPAYVRVGSESVSATESIYKDLLLAQDDKRRFLLDHKAATWTVEFIDKRPGQVQSTRSPKGNSVDECSIEQVSAFFVRLRSLSSQTVFTELLQDLHISYDDKLHRPRLFIWASERT